MFAMLPTVFHRAARSSFFMAALCAAVLLLPGCGNSGRPPMGSVHGRVTLDGKPLAGASVVFKPDDGGHESTAVTNAEGEYVLKYIRDDLGCAVGMNSVRISKLRSHDATSEILPKKYNQMTTLKQEVKSGDNPIDFPLSSK
jgi:hypothetical protein